MKTNDLITTERVIEQIAHAPFISSDTKRSLEIARRALTELRNVAVLRDDAKARLLSLMELK